MGIVHHVGGGVDATGGNTVGGQQGEEVVARQRDRPGGDELVELDHVHAPGRVGGEVLMVGQLGLAHGDAEAGKDRIGVAADEHVRSVGRGIGVGRGHPGQDPPGAGAQDATDLEVGQRRLHHRGHRLVDGHVDLLAPPAALALGHRRQTSDHGEEGGQGVAQADAAPGRGPVRFAGGGPDAAHGLADRAESGLGRPGSGLPESRDVDDDHPRVLSGQMAVAETPFLQSARSEVLEHDVAGAGQPSDHGPALRSVQVDGHRFLVPGDGRPPQTLALVGQAPGAHGVAHARGLDLQDLGPVVARAVGRRRGRR